ncbi:hypothetical protein GOBAR_AA29532 [Gossypium barbadense]|uniref:Fatty acid hydroxylase domain-containing protein n=1 Tax=Gossypium barbadense TaxID=3634 RepID=A0A2P5WJB5_GOSBA|nr:hypothetical protein GOBAR_AA29532 [Gossypium barbadense]
MVAPLSAWPWENLGVFKYLLYGPLAAKVLYSWIYEDSIKDLWDNFLILHALLAYMACLIFPSLDDLPLWNPKGFITLLFLHVTVSEPLYYWAHRYFHEGYLFTHYHSLHHSSSVTHPYTAGHATFLEHLILCIVIGIPMAASIMMGCGSTSMVYGYVSAFDFLRCLGHSNVEVVPHEVFIKLPFLKYFLYTPTYHSLHHTEMGTNFCLFMPLFDAMGNTVNRNSWQLHKKISSDSAKNGRVPDFVFLAHGVDLTSSMHAPFVFRSFASVPFSTRIFLLPLLPVAFLVMLIMWAWSKTFLVSFYNLRGHLHQTWVVPRFGFQYFLPFAMEGINKRIEEAILRADRIGVKVISLAALNKNEALNGGGTLFVEKHPDLKVRVVHGNTLTAAVILNEIPKDVEEVFLTGATSKLGRAIALYLCRRRVRVLMLTLSTERFQKIQREAPADCQNYLVQVTKYQAAQNCKVRDANRSLIGLNGGGTLFVEKHPDLKVRVVHGNTLTAAVILNEIPKDVEEVFLTGATSKLGRAIALYLCRRRVRVLTWIVGKWITPRQQSWAPSGTHFHQFVVPPILAFRRDCTYGDLAAMRLPDDVEGLGSCEYTMERGVVHACHAGGVVHQLEGWTHHEVGAIDVDRIDIVWKAALKHGLRPVSSM